MGRPTGNSPYSHFVIPANVGIQRPALAKTPKWTPTFVGVTMGCVWIQDCRLPFIKVPLPSGARS